MKHEQPESKIEKMFYKHWKLIAFVVFVAIVSMVFNSAPVVNG